MVTLTINRKPQGIFSKSPATPLQDKTNTVHSTQREASSGEESNTMATYDKTPAQKP